MTHGSVPAKHTNRENTVALEKKLAKRKRIVELQKNESSSLEHLIDLVRCISKGKTPPASFTARQVPDMSKVTRFKTPRCEWIQWETLGTLGEYTFEMTYLMMGTMVVISKGDKDILAVSDDTHQRPNTGVGHQVRLMCEEEDLLNILSAFSEERSKEFEKSSDSKANEAYCRSLSTELTSFLDGLA